MPVSRLASECLDVLDGRGLERESMFGRRRLCGDVATFMRGYRCLDATVSHSVMTPTLRGSTDWAAGRGPPGYGYRSEIEEVSDLPHSCLLCSAIQMLC